MGVPVLQVLRGCEDAELQDLHLQRNPALYNFTRQGAGLSVSGDRLRGSTRAPRLCGATFQGTGCWRSVLQEGTRVVSHSAGPRFNRHSVGGLWGSAWPWGAEPLSCRLWRATRRATTWK